MASPPQLRVDSPREAGWTEPGRKVWLPHFSPDVAAASRWPPFTTALREQLGLKLEEGRGAIDVLVIDSVQQPTEN
jgi:uncharacterized protein (TIGR03435 family)